MIKLSIFNNFDQVATLYEKYDSTVIMPATRTSINKSIKFAQNTTVRLFRKRLNVLKRNLKTMTSIRKARGNDIDRMTAVLKIDNQPMPLLWFVKGSKKPESQEGKSIKKRRKIKVQIRKGRTTRAMGAFIQKKRTIQVFRRNPGTGGFFKQSTPRLLHYFQESAVLKVTRTKTFKYFDKTFSHELTFRDQREWSKITDK